MNVRSLKRFPNVAESLVSVSGTHDAAREIDSILKRVGSSARLVVGDWSIVVGRKVTRPSIAFHFKTFEVCRQVLSSMRLYAFAEAYFRQELDIEGPIADAMDILYAINIANDSPQTVFEKLELAIFRFFKATIPGIARRFESDAHYSLDSNAYALFLDPYMQYTCAKYVTGRETLAEAQINKFTLIRDLITTSGGSLKSKAHLDIGCGWGGLVGYADQYLGMHSVGLANNQAQLSYAAERFGARVVLGDFTDIPTLKTTFDLVTVVGMAEHLTPRRRSQLFQIVKRSLSSEGFVYFQCIARPEVWIGGDAYRIAYQEVFPGHYLETRQEMEARFNRLGFEVLYASDDFLDYAKTTAAWVANLESRRAEVTRLIGEQNYRILFGYLAYGSKLFAAGRGSLMRYLLKPRVDR